MRRNMITADPIIDDRPRIPDVTKQTSCFKHGADAFEPCWEVWTDNGRGPRLAAICNDRAKRAGFDAPINPASLGLEPDAA